jgi:hypothetical protein
MIARIAIALSACAIVGTAAVAEQPAPKVHGDPNKVICRTSGEVGSRLKRTRACHTQAEWAELNRQTRATVEHIQDARAANLGN